MRCLRLLVVCLGIASCGKGKPADPPPAPTTGSGSASAPPSGPVAKNQTDVTDNDKTLVINAGQIDANEMTYNAPTGERIPVAVAKREDGGTWKVDVTIGGKLFETIDTKLPKDDASRVPLASVVRIQNVVAVVAGTKTKTEPPAFRFDARVLGWDGKQLTLSKKIAFDHVMTPAPEVEDTHEHANRP